MSGLAADIRRSPVARSLGGERFERSLVRRGYRNGSEDRRITTAQGTKAVTAHARRYDLGTRVRQLKRYWQFIMTKRRRLR